MRQLPQIHDPKILVGTETADDAGVYRLDRHWALVQTVDFFTPIVDDPFTYGEIAAANALSDVYAMGGRPLTALNLMGIPESLVPPAVIVEILRGGAAKVKEAKCALIGGHTIRNPEPIYGLAVTGLVSPKKMMTNARARVNDLLVLTKPLGTGIVTTGIKRGLTAPALAAKAVAVMRRLNAVGALLAEQGLVQAAIDVTGFGLLGHLFGMCQASGVSAELDPAQIPVISPEVWRLIDDGCVPGGSKDNGQRAGDFTDWGAATARQKIILTDAQTSGGLLLAVRPAKLEAVRQLLKRNRSLCARVIGAIVRSPEPRIALRSLAA